MLKTVFSLYICSVLVVIKQCRFRSDNGNFWKICLPICWFDYLYKFVQRNALTGRNCFAHSFISNNILADLQENVKRQLNIFCFFYVCLSLSSYLYYPRMTLSCYLCLFICTVLSLYACFVTRVFLPVLSCMYLSCYLSLFTCIISVYLCLVTCVFYLYYPRMSLSCYLCLLPVLCPLLVTCVFLLVFSQSVSVLLPVFSLYVSFFYLLSPYGSVLLPVSFTYIIPVWFCLVTCVFYLYYPRMTLSCYMCIVFYLYYPRMTLNSKKR